MDHSKKTKLRVNKKSIRTTETAFLNYVFSKPIDKQKKLGLLETNLRNRKKNEKDFDVNNLMGFYFQHNSKCVRYFYDVCFYDDDVELFRLLMNLGLKNTDADSITLDTWFFQFQANRCLKEIYTQPEIAQHFLIGEDSPIFSAICTYNQDILKTMCLHPQFKVEYFTHETTHKKNPMQAAADSFNSEALDLLIQRNAPHVRFRNTKCHSSFDVACNRFLDFFTGKTFINYQRARLSLSPAVQENVDLFDKKYICLDNVIKVFYLLLNNTNQNDFHYQLCLLPEKEEDCSDIFELLEDVVENLRIKDAPFKLLLDILLSAGSGLFFKDLPSRLKSFYSDIPLDAEMVLPVLQQNNKTFQCFYFFEDFKEYLKTNLSHFKIAEGMIQYIECRQKSQLDSACSLFLKEIMLILSSCPDLKENYKRELILRASIFQEDESFACQMQSVLNTVLPETPNLMFLALQRQELNGIMLQLIDPEKLDKIDPLENEFEEAIAQSEWYLKSLYLKWITLDKIFQQGIAYGEESSLLYFRDTYEYFLRSIKKIDYYSMMMLYVYLNKKPLVVAEKIELIKVFLLFIKSIKSKSTLKNTSGDYHSFLRLEFVLHALLIHAYQENNQAKLAKRELEQCMLIAKIEHCGKLFHHVYRGKAHLILVFQAFDNVTKALMQLNNPNLLINWLTQIKGYQMSVLFADNKDINAQSLIKYTIKTIDAELFQEAMLMIDLASFEKETLITYLNTKIDEFLKKLEKDILALGLRFCISINLSKRRLELDYQKIGCSSLRVRKELSIDMKIEQEKIIVEHIHLLTQNQITDIFECVQKMRHIAECEKLVSKPDSTSIDTASVEDLPQIGFLSLYEHVSHNKRQKVKKGKIDKSFNQETEVLEKNTSINKKNRMLLDIDREELKRLAGVDNSYSDLVMIKNPCSLKSKRFLAIKNLPQFQSFLGVCYVDAQNKNQLSVDSINPYGVNQHGVKCFDVKNGAETEYKIKIKSNGSERMIGLGKEVYYEERKLIVYQTDIVLSHKKSEKLFNR